MALPFNPAGLTPTDVAPPRVGEVCVAYAARERAGRLSNARKLTAYDHFYTTIREGFAQPD